MHTIDKLDLVLIMSVNPGFGGQAFIPHALDKLRAARKRVDVGDASAPGATILLEVDGGVKVDNIARDRRGRRRHVRRGQRDLRRRLRRRSRDARRVASDGYSAP